MICLPVRGETKRGIASKSIDMRAVLTPISRAQCGPHNCVHHAHTHIHDYTAFCGINNQFVDVCAPQCCITPKTRKPGFGVNAPTTSEPIEMLALHTI